MEGWSGGTATEARERGFEHPFSNAGAAMEAWERGLQRPFSNAGTRPLD